MGGSSKRQIVGYKYFFGLHMGIGRGPVDALREIRVADKVAWIGNVTANQKIAINKPDLFGGESKEGGVKGKVEVMMGGPTQEASGGLKAMLGSLIPGFRGMFTIFYNGLVSVNNPYPKAWKFRLNRILSGWDGAPWYPEKAPIPTGASYEIPGSPAQDIFSVTDTFDYITLPLGDDTDYSHGVAPWKAGAGPFGNRPHPYPDPDFPDPITLTSHGFSEAVIWVRKQFYLDTDTPITITFRADNVIDVWLNGEPVNPTITGTFTGQTVQVGLPGENELIFRVRNSGEVSSDASNPMYAGAYAYSAEQPASSVPVMAMNPAHIIYECMTNRVWGRGLSASKLDLASFTAAADQLFAEGFGLCLKWTRKDSIENFIQGVIDHIGATLYVSRTTKLYTLKLIRGGYNLNDLPLFDTESGILAISDATVASVGSTVNAVHVKYHDWENDEERSVSVKNAAAIAAAGGVVNQVSRDFPGIPITSLALRVAQRELRAVSTSLRKFTITMDRRGEDFAPGDVFAIQDPKRGIPKLAVRVGRVEDGTLLDGKITLTVVQDVFSLPATTMAANVPPSWVAPNNKPCIDQQRVFEAPYFLMARTMAKADLDYVGADSGYLATLNARGQPMNQGYRIAVRPNAPTSDDNPPDDSYICGL